MDYFQKAQVKDIGVGGYRCLCCTPLTKRKKGRSKTQVHKRARSRLRQERYSYEDRSYEVCEQEER